MSLMGRSGQFVCAKADVTKPTEMIALLANAVATMRAF
jgi:hypothetical protein